MSAIRGVLDPCGLEHVPTLRSTSCDEPGHALQQPTAPQGVRPRAFVNLGVSCWINACLQALWTPVAVKLELHRIFNALPRGERERLVVANAGRSRFDLRSSKPDGSLESLRSRIGDTGAEEHMLAATFTAACVGDFTKPMVPYWITDYFYQQRQEDASEFLTRFILNSQSSPSLVPLFVGRETSVLVCSACGHRQPLASHPVHELELPIYDAARAAPALCTVQEALDFYMHGDEVERRAACDGCGQVSLTYRLERIAAELPQVLLLCLKRWEWGREAPLDHAVEPSDPLIHGGATYRLCSGVIHLGANARAGHYIAVAKHTTPGGLWWLYDDADRRLATPEQVRASGVYRGRRMKLYLVMYERIAN